MREVRDDLPHLMRPEVYSTRGSSRISSSPPLLEIVKVAKTEAMVAQRVASATWLQWVLKAPRDSKDEPD